MIDKQSSSPTDSSVEGRKYWSSLRNQVSPFSKEYVGGQCNVRKQCAEAMCGCCLTYLLLSFQGALPYSRHSPSLWVQHPQKPVARLGAQLAQGLLVALSSWAAAESGQQRLVLSSWKTYSHFLDLFALHSSVNNAINRKLPYPNKSLIVVVAASIVLKKWFVMTI